MTSAEIFAPGVRCLLAPNPGAMTGKGTNTYLVGERDMAVIDPGPAVPAHVEAIADEVAKGGGRLAWIWLTHAHPDHAAAVATLQQRTGARLAAWPRPNPTFAITDLPLPDRPLADGDRLEVDGLTYQALHTPGHASDHLAFFRPCDGLLFTGDAIVGHGTVVIAPPDGDLVHYLESLGRLATLGATSLAPGHGKKIGDPAAKIAEYLAHRLARETQILALLDRGPATIADLVATIYREVDRTLHPVAARQVHGHLLKLQHEGRVLAADDQWRPYR